MSDALWPDSLPKPLVSGLGFSDTAPIVRTQMEQGPDRVTRVADSFVTVMGFGILLDTDQMYDFRLFLNGAANMGASWVTLPIDTGGGIADHRVRFLMPLQVSRRGLKWFVQCRIETDQQATPF